MDTEKKAVNKLEIIRKIINIMKVLQEETDEQHTISQSGLQEALKNKDCVCSTRSLTDYLKTIMLELNPEDVDGYVEDNATIEHYVITVRGLEDKLQARDDGLEREGSKILQLRDLRYNHLFTFDELNQIIEGALFLKHIDDESKVKIINKLKTLSSKKFADYSPYISKNTEQIDMNITGVFEDSRVDDVALRNNIQFIRTAIEKDNGAGCKIAFNGYDENKKLKPRCDAKGNKIRYVASPYYIIMYNGKPYLVCVVTAQGCFHISNRFDE